MYTHWLTIDEIHPVSSHEAFCNLHYNRYTYYIYHEQPRYERYTLTQEVGHEPYTISYTGYHHQSVGGLESRLDRGRLLESTA